MGKYVWTKHNTSYYPYYQPTKYELLQEMFGGRNLTPIVKTIDQLK